MPPKSQSQRRWAYWTASGKNPDASASVGKEFLGHGVKNLPERVGKKTKKLKVKRQQLKRR